MSYGVNLHQAEAGKKSIGGVATEKVQSDGLNLGFPSVYQSVYAAKRVPERYFPTRERSAMPMWAGTDLQSMYHEQKRQDSHHMAGAKVRATQRSRVRFVGTPHGRGILPPAVLGQRKFANPTNGAFSVQSGRQDQPNAPFHFDGSVYESQYKGGVLRSAEGQAYGKARLMDRINQLNEIQTSKQQFTGQMPTSIGVPTQTFEPTAAISPSIELNLLLTQIQDALVAGTAGENAKLDKFDLATTARALGLVFRLSADAPPDFMEDLMAKIESILQLVNGTLDDETESAGMSATARETALSIQVLFTKLREYVERMMAGRDLLPPERLALSKNLVSSLGFSKMLKYAVDANDSGLLSEADRDRLFTAQQQQRYLVGDMDEDEDDDSDFDEPAPNREDEAHATETGKSRSARDFDVDERQTFGFNSGMYYPSNGRGEEAFYGEESRTDLSVPTFSRGAPATVQPSSDIRGRFDPDTQAFNIDVQVPRETAEKIERVREGPARSVVSRSSRTPRPPTVPRPAPPPSVRAPTRPPTRPPTRAPTVVPEVAPAGAPALAITSQRDLPTTREGFDLLAKAINKAGGIRADGTIGVGGRYIQVYSGSSVANIKKNFVKRLNLYNK